MMAATQRQRRADDVPKNLSTAGNGQPPRVTVVLASVQSITTGQHRDERVETHLGYPASYQVRPIAEQIKTLASVFALNDTKALASADRLPSLPAGAEAWFALLRWQAVAPTYGKAFKRVLGFIFATRQGQTKNWLGSKIGAGYLCPSSMAQRGIDEIARRQEGDILIVPAQFGSYYRGQSPRCVLGGCRNKEFFLGAFSVATMLLLHPDREREWEQLHVACVGDRYAYNLGDQPLFVPVFNCLQDPNQKSSWLHLDAKRADEADGRYGAASGFLL